MTYDPAKNSADSYREAIAAKRAKLLMERIPAAKRVEVIGDCELILGDCLEVMPHLEKVDAVVTDPPYGIGVGRMSMGKGRKSSGFDAFDWDSARPPLTWLNDSYLPSIVWGGNYFDLPASGKWLSWDKVQEFSGADFELAWTNLGGPSKAFRMSRVEAYGNIDKQHPTQKPVPLMVWCIKHLPDNCHTILDPFMGSGTTGVACAKLGRRFIGIELDEGYFNIACDRIRKADAQPDLFIETAKAPEPKQEPLL